MTSRPLFISVAESIVIFGPIVHTGWVRASFTLAFASSLRVQPRNGPPEPVMITRLRSSRRSPRRACASAACSESTGSSRSGSPLIRSMTSSPPTTRDSLFASASVLPLCSAARVGAEARGADQGVQHHVGLDRRARPSTADSGPTRSSTPLMAPSFTLRSLAASSSAMATIGRQELADLAGQQVLVRAGGRERRHRNRSGFRRTTSSAWVPIDPVEPRMAMRPHGSKGTPSPRKTLGPLEEDRGGTAGTRPGPRTAGSRSGRGRRRDPAARCSCP